MWVKYSAQENNTDSVSGQCTPSRVLDQMMHPASLDKLLDHKHMDTYHTIPKATLLALMIRRQSDVATRYKCTSMEIPIRN